MISMKDLWDRDTFLTTKEVKTLLRIKKAERLQNSPGSKISKDEKELLLVLYMRDKISEKKYEELRFGDE